ncbi:MAG: deoxyhypusine synthase family protein [Myxococcota bacterium]
MTSHDANDVHSVQRFLDRHYRHFNAAALVDAARAWAAHLRSGGQMMVTLAGAMSTAELGLSLAELIRAGAVHALTCTGANLEEDLFNLVAHDHYVRIAEWRALSAKDEQALLERRLNRVTDTCIPEHEAMRRVENEVIKLWKIADAEAAPRFPHEYLYELIRSGVLQKEYQVDPQDSWLVAAAERDLPVYVPGWEDSTLGNMCVAAHIRGDLKDLNRVIKGGLHAMKELASWYEHTAPQTPLGFFQIGGGIAGDFPICVVPMLHQDLGRTAPLWSYFCQISESSTSYGGYSGAVPNEKITWGKLGTETPKFIIESDATIVAPLVFAYVISSMLQTR